MHNYLKKIAVMEEAGQIPSASLGNIGVSHDSWCLFYRNGALYECNCDPDITYYPARDEQDFVHTAILLNHKGRQQ